MLKKIFSVGLISSLFALSALAQTTNSTGQVGPGSAASISPAQGIGPAIANTPQHQAPDGALTSETRQTLQEAMNSMPADDSAGSEVILGPNEGAEMDSTHVNKIDYASLPASIKDALGNAIHDTLSQNTVR